LKELERSLRAEPENAWAYFNRALTFERLGWTRKALSDFARALEMSNPPLNAHKREAALARLPA
jgi:tetratricopeptide (TPR) repeat protein